MSKPASQIIQFPAKNRVKSPQIRRTSYLRTILPKYVIEIDGIWWVRRSFSTGKRDAKGQLIYVQVKRKCEPQTADQAEHLAIGIERAYKEAQNAPKPGETLTAFLERYLRSKRHSLGQRTSERLEDDLRRHVLPYPLAQKPINAIAPLDVQSYIDKLSCSPSTVQKMIKSLSSAFAQGIHWGMLTLNPTKGCVLPRHTPREMYSFDEAQAKQFLAECRRTGQTILHLALETGLRPGEYCSLSWKDINLDACSLKVERSVRFGFRDGGWQVAPPKTESGRRTVRFSSHLRDALIEHRTRQQQWIADLRRRVKSRILLTTKGVNYQKRKRMRAIARETLANIAKYDLVFPSETGVYQSPNNLNRRQFRKVLTAIGLSPKVYTLYALRHSSFSLLVAAGVDIKTVSERAGHADVGITLRTYIHVNRKMAEGAADALANILYT